MSTKMTKLTLLGLGFLLLALLSIVSQISHLYTYTDTVPRKPKCEHGQVYHDCLSGCKNETLLYVGDTESCHQPGFACCDQIGSAYCNPQGLCSCKPGYMPHPLEGIGRFRVICFVLAGQPCPKLYGYHSVDHDSLSKLLGSNHSLPEHGKLSVKERKLIKLRTLLREKIIKNGYKKTLFDWACESGICNKGICEYGVNPYFEQ